ncbi:hypothetical protein D8674_000075 [Pyrus ussuriensis x Pyrus communis]|uniref:Uncharacterized protein n=1 Tax=Pyrus ussuriensis x Pyrus communis TaxID=2448454 RepID=A0A5N5F2E8_9ROSA|nr:hypothetical protein D8674_000075 [Pyrus ussuriensis x Pyrus communis]
MVGIMQIMEVSSADCRASPNGLLGRDGERPDGTYGNPAGSRDRAEEGRAQDGRAQELAASRDGIPKNQGHAPCNRNNYCPYRESPSWPCSRPVIDSSSGPDLIMGAVGLAPNTQAFGMINNNPNGPDLIVAVVGPSDGRS